MPKVSTITTLITSLTLAFAPPAMGQDDSTPEWKRRKVAWPVTMRSLQAASADNYPAAARAKFAAVQVPVLAAPDMTDVERQTFAESVLVLDDGYVAEFRRGPTDIVLNGTLAYAQVEGANQQRRTEEYLVERSLDGLSVHFTRYNVDYLIEFRCAEASGEDNDCISADAAKAFSRDLIVVGGAGL